MYKHYGLTGETVKVKLKNGDSDGYKNFVVNGVAAENDTLKIRVTVF